MVTRRAPLGEDKQIETTGSLPKLLLALLFVAWVGEWSLELDAVMYNGLWRSPFVMFSPLFEPVPGVRLSSWQLLLLVLVPICLASRGAFHHRAGDLDRALLLSFVTIIITFAWGWLRGGSPYFAYYQVWRWLTALLIAFLLVTALRAQRDLALLGKLIVIAALIRATLCIYFYWAHVRGKGYNLEYMTNHDDTVTFVTAILVVNCWALVKPSRRTWIAAAVITLFVFYAMVLNDRRIAWVELVLGCAAIYVLTGSGPERRQINRGMMIGAPLVLSYVIVGQFSDAAIFAPVRSLAEARSGADLSSLARQEEIRNLLYTLTDFANPLFGTGWGHPYQKLTSLWSSFGSAWLLADYTPHNSLLSSVVFSGFLGLIGIWGVIPVAGLLAARGYNGATDPVPRAAAMVAAGVLVVFSVHCYGDIGFSSLTACLFFGAALAVAGKVSVWSASNCATADSAASSSGRRRRAVRSSSTNPGSRVVAPRQPARGSDSAAKNESSGAADVRMHVRRRPTR